MVGHDDGIVDNQTERNGNARQRIKLDLQTEEVIKDDGNGKVNCQRNGNKKQVTRISGNKQDEKQQDKHRQPASQVNLVQFGMDVFRGIVAVVNFVTGRKCAAEFVDGFVHLPTQPQLVGGFFRRERQVNRIQPVDAVMAVGRLFGVHNFYQLIQADKRTVAVLHGNGRRVESVGIAPRYQHKAHPRGRIVSAFRFRHPQKIGGMVHRNGLADVVYRYSESLQPVGIVGQLPLQRRSAANVDFVQSGNIAQSLFNGVFGVSLDDDGRGG